MRETLTEFIQNLNNEEFHRAHQTMEDQWKIYKQQDHTLTKLLKGYINGATAFELVRRNKIDGAHRLWGVYEKYFTVLTPDTQEYQLFAKADNILRKLKEDRLQARA